MKVEVEKINNLDIYSCPHCGQLFEWYELGKKYNFCYNCGELLNWRDYELNKQKTYEDFIKERKEREVIVYDR